MLEEKGRYRAVGFAMFAVAVGLAALRVGAYFLMSALEGLSDLAAETILDTVFTLLSQVGVCLFAPFLIYMFVGKRSTKQILHDGNFKKIKWWILALCVPLGVGGYLVTWFVSSVWVTFLSGFGYVYNPGESVYPAVFNPLLLLLSLFLTAVLPAICEEFAMRGSLVRTLRHTFRGNTAIIIAALAFGLFHQNIVQILYTSLFGGLAAYLVIKTGSIFPAMVVHFVNNGISVFLGHDSEYGWGVARAIDAAISQTNGGAFFLFLIIGIAVVAGCVALITRESNRRRTQTPVIVLYQPTLRESAWYIGAIAIAVCSTLFTFLFGLRM